MCLCVFRPRKSWAELRRYLRRSIMISRRNFPPCGTGNNQLFILPWSLFISLIPSPLSVFLRNSSLKNNNHHIVLNFICCCSFFFSCGTQKDNFVAFSHISFPYNNNSKWSPLTSWRTKMQYKSHTISTTERKTYMFVLNFCSSHKATFIWLKSVKKM